MAKTIVSLFDDFATAQSAARALIDAGYPRENISVVSNNAGGEYSDEFDSDVDVINEGDLSGAGVGAGIGATLGGVGGLLVGLGAIAIPGIGPVIAAGPLVTALLSAGAGAGIGAVAGGLVGALVDVGVPEEEAGYFAEGVRRGGALLTVQLDNEADSRVLEIINRHQPIDIEERVADWRQSGWSGFDPKATPYTARDLAQERASYRTSSATGSGTAYRENLAGNDPNFENRGWAEVDPAPGERTYQEGHLPTDDPDYASRGWAEVDPAPGEQTYRGTPAAPSDRDSSIEGWAEVEPAPGEQTYRGHPPTDDPDYVSRGWAEVEPSTEEHTDIGSTTPYARTGTTATSGQLNQSWVESREPAEGRVDIGGTPTSYARTGTTDLTDQANQGIDTRPPAEGRADIDENVEYAWEETKNTARQGWEEVKDTARDAWQETKETFDFDDEDDDYDYDAFDTRFHEHYNMNYAGSGYDYETYTPAYRYGYDLAYDIDFEDRDWDQFEPDARRYWEANYEGPWDRFKDAVRHAWEETKEAMGLEADEDFKTFDADFRGHYNTSYAHSGYDYSYYIPAYRYGYDMAYAGYDEDRDWDEIEPEARRYWESNYEGPWEQFKDAVRRGWEKTKEAIGLAEDEHDFTTVSTYFRDHYNTNYANSGYPYDDYAPAYHYGYDLAYDPDYESRTWEEIEPEARREWEANYGSAWDQFKAAVRHAWEETKEAIGMEDEDDDDVYESGQRRNF